ncbi:unnamed protein product [Echinostoma caproni]|uniref:Uncharacterized protein n=1 Tax=Echinostoma caproni TaxID=27848 RepID=A0A183AJA6_9TREM|nr:unnamed protein product [Echinostoma caproni]
MPEMESDQMASNRRFEPSTTRTRKAKRSVPRKYQSMFNINQMPEQSSAPLVPITPGESTGPPNPGSGVSTIGANLNKRLPKWLRWGANKKTSVVECKSDRVVSKVEQAYTESLVTEQKGFLGNLGIGGYIGAEESSFVTSDEVDEQPLQNANGTNQTKSLINLSSLLLWPSQDVESGGLSSGAPILSQSQPARPSRPDLIPLNRERESVSTSSRNNSSVEGSPLSRSSLGAPELSRGRIFSDPQTPTWDRPTVIPELIKVLFLTNTPLGRELMDADTLRSTTNDGSRKPLDSITLLIPFPAWFIHENSPIIPNMTYWVSHLPIDLLRIDATLLVQLIMIYQ